MKERETGGEEPLGGILVRLSPPDSHKGRILTPII